MGNKTVTVAAAAAAAATVTQPKHNINNVSIRWQIRKSKPYLLLLTESRIPKFQIYCLEFAGKKEKKAIKTI